MHFFGSLVMPTNLFSVKVCVSGVCDEIKDNVLKGNQLYLNTFIKIFSLW